jgi:hypothetical protein
LSGRSFSPEVKVRDEEASVDDGLADPGENVDRDEDPEDDALEDDDVEPEDAEAVAEAGMAGKVPPKTGAEDPLELEGEGAAAGVVPNEAVPEGEAEAVGAGASAGSDLRVRGFRDE